MTQLLQKLLTAVLPLMLVGGVLAKLAQPDAPVAVLAVQEIEDVLARKPFEVLVLGNSKARTDQDPVALGRILGEQDSTLGVTAIKVDASNASAWYALLKNRVYAKDHQPKLVIVLSSLEAMLGTTPRTEQDRLRLMEQLQEEEPVIARKAFGKETIHSPWDQIRKNRTRLRGSLVDELRDWSLALIFKETGLAARSLPVVFSEEGMISSPNHRIIPVAEAELQTSTLEVPDNPTDFVQQTFLPDLVALAQEHKARIVFVRSPLAPSNPDHDAVAPEIERAVIAFLNDQQAGYLDLRGLGLQDRDFRDGIHLNAQGRKVFTEALAARLQAINALDDGPLLKAALPITARFSRIGTAPTLPTPGALKRLEDTQCGFTLSTPNLEHLSDTTTAALGLGRASPVLLLENGKPLTPYAARADFADTCSGAYSHQRFVTRFSPSDSPENVAPARYSLALSTNLPLSTPEGDVYWVYPGTSLNVAFKEPWGNDRGDWVVLVEAQGFSEGSEPPLLITGEQHIPLSRVDGQFWQARIQGVAPSSSWSLQIQSPEAGPYLVITQIKIGSGLSALQVLGQPPGSARLLESRMETSSATPEISSSLDTTWPDPAVGHFFVEGTNQISDAIWGNRLDRGRCSPLRVLENETALPQHNRGRSEVLGANAKPGRVVHETDGLFFRSSDGSPPASNGRSYRVQFTEDRRCNAYRWVYPGDKLALLPHKALLKLLGRGANLLVMAGLLSEERPPEEPILTIMLDVDEQPLFSRVLTANELDGTSREWPLPSRVLERARIRLGLETAAGAPYVLLTQALLTEADPFNQ